MLLYFSFVVETKFYNPFNDMTNIISESNTTEMNYAL